MKVSKTAVAIRLLLSAGLLVVAWHHAHWSIALILTGLAMNAEMMVVLINRLERK